MAASQAVELGFLAGYLGGLEQVKLKIHQETRELFAIMQHTPRSHFPYSQFEHLQLAIVSHKDG
jgi:hypothetical protein